jgi:hypothetical protein
MIVQLRRPTPFVLNLRQQLVGTRADVAARLPLLVPILAAAVSIAAIVWAGKTGSMDLYGDARARTDVARHITDGLTPGLAQLGSVWLPLPPLLMSPFAAIDPLWHSGAAGAIVSGLAFFYSAIRIFSIAEEWLGSRLAAWCAFAVYATNLNLLYVQTTALTEPVLLALFVGAVYHLTRWTRNRSSVDLAWAAAMVMLSTLTRYDGWALLLVGTIVVWVWSQTHERRAKATQASVLLFLSIAAYGVVLWILYNLIIFHNPWEFITSTFSSQSQQRSLAQVGALATNFNLVGTVSTFGWDLLDIVGVSVIIVGVAGAVTLLWNRGAVLYRNLAILTLLATPIVFNTVTLFLGQSTMRVPQVAPFQMWNNRYGLMALPFFALTAAALVQRRRYFAPLVLVAAAAAVVLFTLTTPLTLRDGQSGVSNATGGRPPVVAHYLGAHYTGGGVLADDASATPLIFDSGLNLREFVTIGFHPYYENSLASPATNVKWVLAHDGDQISVDMHDHPDRFGAFHAVATDGYFTLFERN